MKTTDWYNPSQVPERPGVYQKLVVLASNDGPDERHICYAHFNCERWGVLADTLEQAIPAAEDEINPICTSLPWRGLAEPPEPVTAVNANVAARDDFTASLVA